MKQELENLSRFFEEFTEKVAVGCSIQSFWELFDLKDYKQPFKDKSVRRLVKAFLTFCTVIQERDKILLSYATIDALTGAYNRSFFEKQIETITAKSKSESTPLSLILIDIDDFKKINDTHGHASGDKVLIALVRIIKRITRADDLVIRFGGDEFLVVLINATCDRANLIKERITTEIEKWNAHNNFGFSVSIGCASWQQGKDIFKQIQEADSKMYEVKNEK